MELADPAGSRCLGRSALAALGPGVSSTTQKTNPPPIAPAPELFREKLNPSDEVDMDGPSQTPGSSW